MSKEKKRHYGKPLVPRELTASREDTAWRLRVLGRSQDYIAKELGITQCAVSLMLDRMHDRYRKELDKEVKHYNALHIAQLESIFAEAIEAWSTDLKPAGARDATYLSTALSALESIRKIVIGKQKEHESEVTDSAGQDPLDKILGLLDTARARRDSQSAC